jgi:hypothetical protein
VGDVVLLRTKELLHAAGIRQLRPRWDGPFAVTACRAVPQPQRVDAGAPVADAVLPGGQLCRLKLCFDSYGVVQPPHGRPGVHLEPVELESSDLSYVRYIHVI